MQIWSFMKVPNGFGGPELFFSSFVFFFKPSKFLYFQAKALVFLDLELSFVFYILQLGFV